MRSASTCRIADAMAASFDDDMNAAVAWPYDTIAVLSFGALHLTRVGAGDLLRRRAARSPI